jgi:hypothetical protein
VEKKASEYAINDFDDYAFCGYISGYNQALEDNKEKKYTEEDMRKAIELSYSKGLAKPNSGRLSDIPKLQEEVIQSLQPKTEWEVEIVDGKLKLK